MRTGQATPIFRRRTLLAAAKWLLVSAGTALVGIGWVLRRSGHPNIHEVGHALSVLGYGAIVVIIASGLRSCRRPSGKDLFLDTILLGLAAFAALWTFVIYPLFRSGLPNGMHESLGACYLFTDALLLTFVAYSIVVLRRPGSAMRLLQAGVGAALASDLIALANPGTPTAAGLVSRIALPPYLLAIGVGVAALQPSMSTLGSDGPTRVGNSLRWGASALIVALTIAAVIPVVGAHHRPMDRIVVCALFAMLSIGGLVRNERFIARSLHQARLANLRADRDPLTGLLNRAAVLRVLDDDTWIGRPLSVLFVDLDAFKSINDRFGHAVGDEVIALAANRIRDAVGADDTVARYGGDEFVVVTGGSEVCAARLSERLTRAFTEPFEFGASRAVVGVSIGTATLTPTTSRPRSEDLLRAADAAMYSAKNRSAQP